MEHGAIRFCLATTPSRALGPEWRRLGLGNKVQAGPDGMGDRAGRKYWVSAHGAWCYTFLLGDNAKQGAWAWVETAGLGE